MFLAWYDPTKKRPVRDKLEAAIERYEEKFGAMPQTCLTHPLDAAELTTGKKPPPIEIRAVSFLPRSTFYVGTDEEARDSLAPAA
ncbi:MAG: hypothetical protein M3411_00780 [Chloroflexota bacterium]|jgi:hypothetical protein|nr:hypothetical protein [Chloroflexia bacterium]MDQ3466754.1 hypothetical protein [Chloroflexota bacterium]